MLTFSYHRILFDETKEFKTDIDDYKYNVDSVEFIKQISFLKNFESVLITFDDGYEDHYYAAKVLKSKGMKGIFFIVSDYINQPGFLSEEQIIEMDKFGMEIQCHGKRHIPFNQLNNKELKDDLSTAKIKLSKIINKEIHSVSLPGGHYNKEVLFILKKLGFKTIYSSIPLKPLYNMEPRIAVLNSTSTEYIGKVVNKDFLIKHKIQASYIFKEIIKKSIPKRLFLKVHNFYRLKNNKELVLKSK